MNGKTFVSHRPDSYNISQTKSAKKLQAGIRTCNTIGKAYQIFTYIITLLEES
jgi:hypothetical protein